MHADNQIFSSLPGAAKRLAARLLAEWGDDRTRYTDCGSVQALAGTAPVAYQSGTYAKAHTRYACVGPLRNALQQFAWQSTKLETWARRYYERKRAEGKSHSMAIRCLANIWVRIIYAMWQTERCYEAAVFAEAQQQHMRKAA
jgi:transposase